MLINGVGHFSLGPPPDDVCGSRRVRKQSNFSRSTSHLKVDHVISSLDLGGRCSRQQEVQVRYLPSSVCVHKKNTLKNLFCIVSGL